MDRVLLISNARAGSVSDRTREVIVKALSADFKLEVADTVARNHASELSADAVDRGFDAVLVFGGDGTVNEAAQGLVGTGTALGVLPGGSTNVTARSIGVPADPVEATAFIAARLRSRTTRRINVGRLGDRYFLVGAGMGLDAEVVHRVEADPEAKRRNPHRTFLINALKAGATQYRSSDPGISVSADGADPVKVVFVVCANLRPLTYYKRWPVDGLPQATLDGGLDLFGLTKVRLVTIPRIAWSVFVSRSHVRWRSSIYVHDFDKARWEADRPLPMQVDGDYLGESDGVDVTVHRDALALVI